jgi:hypothetical protein
VDGCTGIGTKYADVIEPLLVFDFLPIEYNYYYGLQEGPFCTRPVFCALGESDPSKYCSRSINGGEVGPGACTPINVNTPEPLAIGMCRYCITRTTLTEAEQDYLADHTVKQRVYQYSEDCIPLEIEGGGT